MTILRWRDAHLRSGADKGALQRFRCTDDDLKTEIGLLGVRAMHPRIWEWHVQQIIQEDVRAMKKARWIVRLGFDDRGLGCVAVAEEVTAGQHYYIVVGALASRLRRLHHGKLGDEMLDDMFSAVSERAANVGVAGEVRLTGMVHRDNYASKRLCERNGFRFDGLTHEDGDYEDWSRSLVIPGPRLFD